MAQALRNQQRREAQFHKHTGMAVTNVMHPDFLYSDCFTGSCHNMIYDVFCVWENSVILFQAVPLPHVIPEGLYQQSRDRDPLLLLGVLGEVIISSPLTIW